MDTEIPPNECLVYTSRKGWAQDLKYNPKQHKNFKYSSFGEEGKEFDYSGSAYVDTYFTPIKTAKERQREPDISLDFTRLDFDNYFKDKNITNYEGID